MRSAKDLFYKIMRISLLISAVSFFLFLVDLFMLLLRGSINIKGSSFSIDDSVVSYEIFFWILLFFIIVSLIVARVMHDMVERKGELMDVDAYRRQNEKELEHKEKLEQKEIDRLDRIPLKIQIKEFFSKVWEKTKEIYGTISEKVKDLFEKINSKLSNMSQARKEKAEAKKARQEELRIAREAELALIEAEEAEEARRLEELKLNEIKELKDEDGTEPALDEEAILAAKRQASEEERHAILDKERAEKVQKQEEAKLAKDTARQEKIEQTNAKKAAKEAEKERVKEEKRIAKETLEAEKAEQQRIKQEEYEAEQQRLAELAEQQRIEQEAKDAEEQRLAEIAKAEEAELLAKEQAELEAKEKIEQEAKEQAEQEAKEQAIIDKAKQEESAAETDRIRLAVLSGTVSNNKVEDTNEEYTEEPEVEPVIEKAVPKPVKAKPAKTVTKTKADIIEMLFETTDISKNKANKFLKFFAEVVKETLTEREDIDLDGFGTFTTIEMPEKDAVNPQTNEKIVVPAHHQVRFRVSDDFKDKF